MTTSFWIATSERPEYPALGRDLRVDVAVVGAGIVGITTALLLERAGKSVALLEARRVAEGVTGHTTAKVTSLHTLIYAHLRSAFGEEKARLYGQANQAALETIRRLCAEHQLDCELEERTAYTFAEDASDVGQIEQEVEAAQAVGLPASYHDELPLPFSVAAAVGFSGQAAFHPR